MNKAALLLSFFKNVSKSRSVWDNFFTVTGGIAAYMLYNRLSVFDVYEWLCQLSSNDWSDFILALYLGFVGLMTGKEFKKGVNDEEPILLTDRVDP